MCNAYVNEEGLDLKLPLHLVLSASQLCICYIAHLWMCVHPYYYHRNLVRSVLLAFLVTIIVLICHVHLFMIDEYVRARHVGAGKIEKMVVSCQLLSGV